jgi:hypothetical protein
LENQSLHSNEVVANLLYFQKDNIFGKNLEKHVVFLMSNVVFQQKLTTFVKIKNWLKKRSYHVTYQSFEEYGCNTNT